MRSARLRLPLGPAGLRSELSAPLPSGAVCGLTSGRSAALRGTVAVHASQQRVGADWEPPFHMHQRAAPPSSEELCDLLFRHAWQVRSEEQDVFRTASSNTRLRTARSRLDKRFETYLQQDDLNVALTGVCDVFSTRRDQGVAASTTAVCF
mgnify:CR=1 FL=1